MGENKGCVLDSDNGCCDDKWLDKHNRTCEMLRNSGDNDPFLVGVDGSLSGYRCYQFCRKTDICQEPEYSECINYVKPDHNRSTNRTINNIDFHNQNSDHSCKTWIRNTGWCDDRNDGDYTRVTDCNACASLPSESCDDYSLHS